MAKKKAAKKKSAKSPNRPTLAQRIAENKRETERAKNLIARSGQKLFKNGVKEIFRRFKGLESFSWVQYTPHWNDGDTCEFSVHSDSLAINEECEGGYDEIESTYQLERLQELLSDKENEERKILREIEELKNGKDDKWRLSQLESDLEGIRGRNLKEVEEKLLMKGEIATLIEGIEESVFQDMFGEGKVVVTREGSEVEDYEHD